LGPQQQNDKGNSDIVDKELNKLIKKVSSDIEAYRFNTAIAAFMQFLNQVKDQSIDPASIINFLRLLYPFTPHLSEELHELLGGQESLQQSNWPEFDPSKVIEEVASIIIQINGKVRDKLQAPLDATESDLKQQALSLPKIQTALSGKEPVKIIVVPNRLVNIVTE